MQRPPDRGAGKPGARHRARRAAAATAAGLVLWALPVLAWAAPAWAGERLAGPACVEDGETLVLGSTLVHGRCSPGIRLRLDGVAAPGPRQSCIARDGRAYACGQVAADALRELIGGRTVRCEVAAAADGAGGSRAATCRAGTTELGPELVRKGWAVARGGASPALAAAEAAARGRRAGLWAGRFADPRGIAAGAGE